MSAVTHALERLAAQKLGIAIGVAATLAVVLIVSLATRDGANRPSPMPTSYTLRPGDVVHDPSTATSCVSSGEGGKPNLFCTRTSHNRFQVVFYNDAVLLFDLQKKNREPLAPDYVFDRIVRTP